MRADRILTKIKKTMEGHRLKEEMKRLWKETFGDSDKYVDLVFDTYFDPADIAFREEEGKLAAMLLGVPYSFGAAGGKTLRGLYLCGVATHREKRHQGLMTALMDQMNALARESGYDFTFLLPASDATREYYRHRGYHNAFYKVALHYVKGHEFNSAYGLEMEELREKESITESLVEEMVAFLSNCESAASGEIHEFMLHHSPKDWKAIIEEASISAQPIFIGRHEGRIAAVGFTAGEAPRHERNTIEIKSIFAAEREAEVALLAEIERQYPDKNLTVVKDFGQAILKRQYWSPFYAVNNPPADEYEDINYVQEEYDHGKSSFPFGMLKMLDPEGFLKKIGVLPSKELEGYTPAAQLLDLLMRRPSDSGSDTLETLLDLPELSFSMSLLLE